MAVPATRGRVKSAGAFPLSRAMGTVLYARCRAPTAPRRTRRASTGGSGRSTCSGRARGPPAWSTSGSGCLRRAGRDRVADVGRLVGVVEGQRLALVDLHRVAQRAGDRHVARRIDEVVDRHGAGELAGRPVRVGALARELAVLAA